MTGDISDGQSSRDSNKWGNKKFRSHCFEKVVKPGGQGLADHSDGFQSTHDQIVVTVALQDGETP